MDMVHGSGAFTSRWKFARALAKDMWDHHAQEGCRRKVAPSGQDSPSEKAMVVHTSLPFAFSISNRWEKAD